MVSNAVWGNDFIIIDGKIYIKLRIIRVHRFGSVR